MLGSRFVRIVLVGSMVWGLGVAPASAAPWKPKSKPARALLDEGRATYKAGNYAQAAAAFLRSAEAEASHVARWNAAQAFASAGDWRRALALFDQLIADKTLPKAHRAEIVDRQRIATRFIAADDAAASERWDEAATTLRALIADTADLDRSNATRVLEAVTQRRAEADAAARAQLQAAERAKPDPEPPQAAVTQPVEAVRPSPPPPQPQPRASRLSDTIAVSLVGVGLVGVGVGAGFWWHAGKLDADSNDEIDEIRIHDLRDRASTQRTIGQIALGTGAAVLVAGAIKLAIPPDAPRPTLATVQPVNGGAMLVLGGGF